MFVKELWRYPAKSMGGEQVSEEMATLDGFADDRKVLVVSGNGRVVTARTHHRLLGLKGSLATDGTPLINGHRWDSDEAAALVAPITGPGSRLIYHDGVERFDVLPLLVATDGAIAHMGFDGRRLRPNIVIGGVEGLAEREWPGRRLRIGGAVVRPAQLRGRCVMTTYHPDTLVQDRTVLKKIVSELEGVMALDTAVLEPGLIRLGDPVELLD